MATFHNNNNLKLPKSLTLDWFSALYQPPTLLPQDCKHNTHTYTHTYLPRPGAAPTDIFLVKRT
jgi:hypothetical protein